ncbi:MAG: DJ-1/PfpI family protein [Proteobacteria bacterium]|nr:DJ-1/PfpI family protein [Pseudomonadota bacterium]MDA0959554.1 DJ-1/PfpI family protein [Pseudomonadota bacterium]MDA1151840.1 DJ-1/PfpI family protein [Pseudomonadota bacterium]
MKLSNFSGKTIAIMVASGFDEAGFIAIQRAMMNAGAKLKIVSREAGLTNAWNGTGWGMSYPADATLSTALAVDYDALIVPAGNRHVESLKNEAHAKRVLRAVLREDMPVLLQGEAVSLLSLIDEAADRTLAAADDNAPIVDRNLVTIAAASEQLVELSAMNDAMANIGGESRAA